MPGAASESRFIITGSWAMAPLGGLLATHMADAQETPSAIGAGGIFLTRTYTRLLDVKP